MQPFNLSQALAGKPFTNDKGWTVEDWHYFKGAVRSMVVKWKGEYWPTHYLESELFMLPEKKKVWIVVYDSDYGIDSVVFEHLKMAERHAKELGNRHHETIEKEYEL